MESKRITNHYENNLNVGKPKWKLYMYGSTPEKPALVYCPPEDYTPNWLVRIFYKVFFNSTWIKQK
jgi:hypothetical protein